MICYSVTLQAISNNYLKLHYKSAFHAQVYSHLDPLDLDAPGVGGLVEGLLHDVADGLPLGEDLGQVLRAQHVPQRRRSQQPRRVTGRRGQSQYRVTYAIDKNLWLTYTIFTSLANILPKSNGRPLPASLPKSPRFAQKRCT